MAYTVSDTVTTSVSSTPVPEPMTSGTGSSSNMATQTADFFTGTPDTGTGNPGATNTMTYLNGGGPAQPTISPPLTSATIIPPPKSPASATPSAARQVPMNVTVPADAPAIETTGTSWTTTNSTCHPDITCKKTSVPGQTLKFSFIGTAVYMNTSRSSNNGIFSVSIDNSTPIQVDTYQNLSTAQCGVTWSSSQLFNGPHVVVVTSLGQSEQAAADGVTGAATFELDGFTVSSIASNSAALPTLVRHSGRCILVSLFVILFVII